MKKIFQLVCGTVTLISIVSFADEIPFQVGGPLTASEIRAAENYIHRAEMLNEVGDPQPTWSDKMLDRYEKHLFLMGKLRLQIRDGGQTAIPLMTQAAKLMKARADKYIIESGVYEDRAYKLELDAFNAQALAFISAGHVKSSWSEQETTDYLYLLDRLMESSAKLAAMDKAYPGRFWKDAQFHKAILDDMTSLRENAADLLLNHREMFRFIENHPSISRLFGYYSKMKNHLGFGNQK
jgi:hypothetical protein